MSGDRWEESTKYSLPFEVKVWVLKSYAYEPPKYYTELSWRGSYQMSLGTKAPTKLLAVLVTVIKWLRLTKET